MSFSLNLESKFLYVAISDYDAIFIRSLIYHQ